jgi:hypothetical protein
LALVDTTLQDFWWVPFITLCALWNWPEVIWMTWSLGKHDVCKERRREAGKWSQAEGYI